MAFYNWIYFELLQRTMKMTNAWEGSNQETNYDFPITL